MFVEVQPKPKEAANMPMPRPIPICKDCFSKALLEYEGPHAQPMSLGS